MKIIRLQFGVINQHGPIVKCPSSSASTTGQKWRCDHNNTYKTVLYDNAVQGKYRNPEKHYSTEIFLAVMPMSENL